MVPTFRPPPESVELIQALAARGPVLVSDDASPCTKDPTLAVISEVPGVTVIRNSHNRGIARALNQGLTIARDRGCRWLLTLDQDSFVDIDYSPSMVAFADRLLAAGIPVGAVGAGDVRDASGPLVFPTRTIVRGREHVVVTEEVVQSGTLWLVDALTQVGGFDEDLGMDAIDAAACLGLRSHDFVVAVNPDVSMEHRIEGAQQLTIIGRTVMVTGHSPSRRRSIVRNRLRLFPGEFRESPVHAVRTVRRSLVNYLALPLRRRS